MPGLLLQDSGFSFENGAAFALSNAFCSQHSSACSALEQDKIYSASSSHFPSDSPLANSIIPQCLDASNSNLLRCFDTSCNISRTLSNPRNRCGSALMRTAATHDVSARSWSPPSIDVNNGDDELAGSSFQDYETMWSDAENGMDGSSLSRCNTGIMLGSFFCDMTKDVTKGAVSISAEGSPNGSTSPTVASPLSKFTSLSSDDSWTADHVDASDEFRMFEFKVRRCTRSRSHDWTECPFAHPGEKARRRDPRRFHYSGTACPDFRKGNCKRGDACEFAHGVFECWLHPARYRTQPCKDGRSCTRRVCFFAHTPEQLRLLPAASSALKISGTCDLQTISPSYHNDRFSGNSFSEDILDENAPTFGMLGYTGSYDGSRCLHIGSPRVRHNSCTSLTASPTSTLARMPRSPPSISPPLSPSPSSPASVHTWLGRPLSPALPIAVSARSFPLLSPSRSNFPRVQALLAAAQADASSFNSVQHVSVPLSFPGYAHANMYKSFSSAPSSPSDNSLSPSRNDMNDLVTAVQKLDLKNVNQMWLQHSCSPHASSPSPLSRTSNTPVSYASDNLSYSDAIDEDDYKLQRVESGKAFRAKFYGKVAETEKQVDHQDENPDLGWVNDLVLE